MKHHIVLGVVSLFGLSLILLACGTGRAPATVAVAFVTQAQNSSMSVIDIPADKTASTFKVGPTTGTTPVRVAVTPDGSRVYATDGTASIWVVDTKSNRTIDKIASEAEPEEIAITPDGKRAYVTTITCGLVSCSAPGNPTALASVEVIDLASNSITSTITIGPIFSGTFPQELPETFLSGIAISPNSTRAYVTNAVGNKISVIDTTTNKITTTISTTASGFDGVAVSPDGKSVYAVGLVKSRSRDSGLVDVIDTQTNSVTTSIGLTSDLPDGIAITPDGGHAYVIGEAGDVWVIDTSKNAVVALVQVSYPNPLFGVAVTPDGTRAYMTSANNLAIYALDTTTNRVVDTIPNKFPGGPGALAITRASVDPLPN